MHKIITLNWKTNFPLSNEFMKRINVQSEETSCLIYRSTAYIAFLISCVALRFHILGKRKFIYTSVFALII
jgi:hypothetical protein